MKTSHSIFLIFLLILASSGYSQTEKEYSDRGLVRYLNKDYYGAIADYTNAIDIDPKNAETYCLRGAAKNLLKDYNGAIADYTNAIFYDQNYATAYYFRGNAKDKINDYYGAIADLTKAIFYDPKNATAYYKRGLAKHKLGLKDEGCLDLNKANELGSARAYEAIEEFCLYKPHSTWEKYAEISETAIPTGAGNKSFTQKQENPQSNQDQINIKMGENIILFFIIFMSGLFLVTIIWIFNKLLKMKQVKNAELIDFEKELLIQPDDQITEVVSVSNGLICSNCGATILKEIKFCSSCGSPNTNVFQTIKTKSIDLESFERLATFKERLLAKLIDFFFLIVIMIFALPAILEVYPDYPKNQWILMIVGTVITILYHSIWLSSSYQATPGRFLKHLQVVRTNSKAISFPFAVLRDLAEWITTATFFIGYLIMLLNKDKMTLHDYLVSTIVVKRKPDIRKESIYFHYRNIVYLGYGGILMGFITIFLSGKTMSEIDKIGDYIGGVASIYAILLVVLFFKYIKKAMTGQWTNSQYNITWPIFFVILASYIYNTINP